MVRLHAAFLSLGLSVGGVSTARAETLDAGALETARALAYQSQAAFDAGAYETSVERADAAQRLVAAPTLALLEARALKKLGRWLDARVQYRLAAAPLPADASEAFVRAQETARAELRLLDDTIPRLSIERPSNAAGARLWIDDEEWPSASFGIWVPVDPGRHRVRVENDDGTRRYFVEVSEGQRRRLRTDAPPRSPESSPRLPLALTALGVGAVGMGVGLALDVGNRPGSDAGAAVGYVVGGLGLATGSIVLLAWPRAPEAERPAVALGLGAGRVELAGTF